MLHALYIALFFLIYRNIFLSICLESEWVPVSPKKEEPVVVAPLPAAVVKPAVKPTPPAPLQSVFQQPSDVQVQLFENQYKLNVYLNFHIILDIVWFLRN